LGKDFVPVRNELHIVKGNFYPQFLNVIGVAFKT